MNFTNETIDLTKLPKFEEVKLLPLQKNYWKIILIGNLIFLLIATLGLVISYFTTEKVKDFWPFLVGVIVLMFLMSLLLGRIGFRKRGYAFRQHDLLYKHGVISETTTIIPYSRVQHVELKEGPISRIFGLASIGIFTAGGSNSDIEIPGIDKNEAQQIKQLLMSKLSNSINSSQDTLSDG